MSAEPGASFLADRPLPYCKGCGHGVVSRRLNDALVRLGVRPEQVVLTSDIGCVGLVDPLFPEVHTVHTIHGRSTAVASGAVLADALLGDGSMKNVVMIGDGGATIGLLHLAQAALMNVDLTVLLHNNMLYGMTGGQHSAFTPEGFATSTTPQGNFIPAIDMEHFVRGCQGGFFARKLATNPDLAEVIAEAIAHPGFAMVEVLELCTGFGVPLNRLDGKSLERAAAARGHALGVLIRRDDRRAYHELYRERFPRRDAVEQVPSAPERRFRHRLERATTVVIAGSAGERVQTAGALLSQAAVLSGLFCVQKNDYPVTVGSGFSLSEVQLSPEPILYTGCDAPDALLVVSADGLKEAKARGDLARLAPAATLVADQTLAAELPAERTLALPLRSKLTPGAAAFGAVSVLVAKSGLLEREALLAAIEVLGGKGRAALAESAAAAFALADAAG